MNVGELPMNPEPLRGADCRCGHANAPAAQFCARCGSELSDPARGASDTRQIVIGPVELAPRLAALAAAFLFAVLIGALYYNSCQAQRDIFGYAVGAAASTDQPSLRERP